MGDVEQKVTDLYYAQYRLDQTFPGSGLRAGIDFIDNSAGAYDTMQAVWESKRIYVPDKGDIAYEYSDWLVANATAPDHSVRAFLDQREQTGPGKSADMPPVTPQMIADQGNFELVTSTDAPQRTATGDYDVSGMQRVTPNQAIWMRAGPSMNNPGSVELIPGMPLWITDRRDGWSLLVAPGNQVGWVPDAALNIA